MAVPCRTSACSPAEWEIQSAGSHHFGTAVCTVCTIQHMKQPFLTWFKRNGRTKSICFNIKVQHITGINQYVILFKAPTTTTETIDQHAYLVYILVNKPEIRPTKNLKYSHGSVVETKEEEQQQKRGRNLTLNGKGGRGGMLLSARVKVRERSPARSQGATNFTGPQSGHAQETKLSKARRPGAHVHVQDTNLSH